MQLKRGQAISGAGLKKDFLHFLWHSERALLFRCGFSSVVGRSLGLANKCERFGAGAEYEAYAEEADAETWALMVGRRYSPAGYAWVFPASESKVRIGVGIGRPESDVDPLRQLTYLLEKRPGPLKKLGRVCPIEFHYGVVPDEGPRSVTVADRVLLVGDSAGHLNPLLLEGITFAIRFGRFAGDAVKRAVNDADALKVQVDEYEKRWKSEVWHDFQIGPNVQKKWLEMSDEEWDKEMSVFDSISAREVLELLQAQFSTRKLMRVAVRHPQLLRSKSFSIISNAKRRV